MADINLSDITGVPVVMPVVREITPTITLVNAAGLTVDTSNMKFYRMGRKLFVTGQVAFGGTGTSAGVFGINIGLTSKAYAQSSSISLFKVGGGAGQPGSVTMGASTSEIYFRKDDASAVADILGNTIGNTSGRFVIFRGSAFFDIEGWDDYEAIGTGVATKDRPGLVSNAVKPTALVASDFTTQTNCYIEETDLPLNRNYWTLNNNVVTVYLWFDTFSIATLVPSFSWVFPESIPRPRSSAGGLGIVFDNSGSVGAPVQVTMLSNGTFQVGKLGGGNFSGGSHTSYLRMQFSWPIN